MKMRNTIIYSLVIMLAAFWIGIPNGFANSEQGLRYSCSAQVYEAFENSRLQLFTAKTGIPVDLFIASSNSCIYRVMQDMTDVASSTRPIYRRHKDYGLIEIPFCKDPLAVIVNKALPVDELTSDQLRGIFSGSIANWKEVGGPNLKIWLVVPHADTGAHKNFRRQIMKHKDIQYDYMTYKSTSVLDAVEGLPIGAVSFVSKGAQVIHPEIKVLSIDEKKPGDSDYEYYQIFYLISKGKPAGSIAKFVDFIKSKEGKSIIKERGMLPME
ncbi:substrate-binding domain-containing protein [Desulfospira joergensenii]|uniref:substrate-binding domain-containing protein n=1 Tax=Desulfospira joergensenii TaxID=53329 RepID=UPI0003B520A1|nr:substrate-binding domain-containing protein [Desulfospira joergensenii]